MFKWSSGFTRFLLHMLICLLAMAAAFFLLSSYFFDEIYTAVHYNALSSALTAADDTLASYRAGHISREELQSEVNPTLNADRAFYMLLDEDRQVLAYTDSAVPYLAGDTVPSLLDALDGEGAASVRSRAGSTTALLMGRKTENGYALAGRPMRLYSGAGYSFRNRMLLSIGLVLMITLILGLLTARRAARPARVITEMAGRLVEGEQVTLPENLPGQEMREIAGALNYMSRTVAKAIGDLKCEKETMSLILEGLSEGILAVDETGGILHENAAAWQLLGGEETAAYRTVIQVLLEQHEEDAWIRKFLSSPRMLYVAVSRLPRQENGGHRGTVALIRDITEQERLERTRHDYVANISHELRTPLASIRGLGEGLRDGLVTKEEDRQRHYNIIVDEATRLSRLVNDLLELSSLQSNPAAFDMEKVDPNELIYELHDLNATLFRDKGITFVRALPKEPLPPICTNEDRLSQALTIFLDNARKYTPAEGKVTLGAQREAAGVRFFVRDTGVGMDEETKRLAFERFHQAERSHSEQGSGLGLSIAREILDKMGVGIELTSAPGAGSEFAFVIGLWKKTGEEMN